MGQRQKENRRQTQARKPAASGFYRCPACGEEVDNKKQEDIRTHHGHVLHPQWFDRAAYARSQANNNVRDRSDTTSALNQTS